jgi:hypothetical protein
MISTALLISFCVVGLHIVIKEFIHHFTGLEPCEVLDLTKKDVDGVLHNTWLTHICKPLFACVTCMSSVWGTVFYIILNPYVGMDVYINWIPTLFMVALFGTVIFKIFKRI